MSDENKVIEISTAMLHSIASGLQYYSKVLPAGLAFGNSASLLNFEDGSFDFVCQMQKRYCVVEVYNC